MQVMTYLTVPISASELSEGVEQIKAAKDKGAEAVELRTDYLEELSVGLVEKLIAEARELGSFPLIATCRDKREGGCFEYANELRVDVLAAAIEAGADYVDLEYNNYLMAENREKVKSALEKDKKSRLILSAHNFEGKFENIHKLYGEILALEPEAIPKLVYTAGHINDCFEGFDLLDRAEEEAIIFCMGQAGKVSRIAAKKLGSLLTFASLDEKSATAPGQITIEQFKNLYRCDSIDEKTELYGIIGWPVGHSASPLLHNSLFAEIGANKLYLPLLVEGGKNEFDEFMDNVLARDWLDFRGFSVTIPHKRNALDYVKARRGFIEPLAERIGAVNTITTEKDGKLSAYNTDYSGALDAITDGMRMKREGLQDLDVTVIGAGGAARAIVAGLSDVGAKIKIYNRTIEKAKRLAGEFGCEWAGLDDLRDIDAKLVINCTSIGMYPNVDETPLQKKFIKKDMVVFDTVYNPAETLLLKQAKEIGAKTIDGLSMFAKQALAQFKLFTGQDADWELMRKTIYNFFSDKKVNPDG